jgi:hypothetical protein
MGEMIEERIAGLMMIMSVDVVAWSTSESNISTLYTALAMELPLA